MYIDTIKATNTLNTLVTALIAFITYDIMLSRFMYCFMSIPCTLFTISFAIPLLNQLSWQVLIALYCFFVIALYVIY